MDGSKKGDRLNTNRAYRIFESLVDVSVGRRPMFVAHGKGIEGCHINLIKLEFLRKCDIDCEIMMPTFRPNGHNVVFVPFNYILPELVAKATAANAYDLIRNSIEKIIQAGNLLIKQERATDSVIYLRNFKKIVPRLSFLVPAERGRKKLRKLTLDKGNVGEEIISEEDFFRGMNFDGIYKDWKFFTHCLKIDFTDFTWQEAADVQL